MRIARTAALAALLSFIVVTAARAEVQLTIREGRVSLNATNATVRQILEEWARVGQTRVVNVERVTGAPITVQFEDMPEAEALAIILRSVSGYLTAPRATPLPQGSYFDRILVMPTSVPRAASAPPQPAFPGAAANPTFPGPGANPAFPPPFSEPAADDRDIDPVGVAIPNPNNGNPVFNTFPQPQNIPGGAGAPPGMVNPALPQSMPQGYPGAAPGQQAPPAPNAAPATMPTGFGPVGFGYPTSGPAGGVPVPGMIVQPPQQQVQPGTPVKSEDR